MKRHIIQGAFTAITNSYYKGFLAGSIYQGNGKALCLQGLNCYSCPGALGSCPIGSFQAVAGARGYTVPFYLIGFFLAFGAFFGRFVCGYLCPFGLFQDLLHKIPFPKKIRKVPFDKYLKYLKYFFLLVFVFLLPAFVSNDFGVGDPWFCKYVCPSGTFMAGWPLVILNGGIRGTIGFLFAWKSFILIAIIILSIIIYRPFCRYICPLGAIYGCFNKVSFYRFNVNKDTCIECKKCQEVCKFDIPVYLTPNSMDCIRCGDCLKVCPTNALQRIPYLRSQEELLSDKAK
ncbi:MAG: 4Fe-4S binding protein [Clostridiales bacterium]|nr:4Fe-4S binding protein [Clostridiales bacterium]